MDPYERLASAIVAQAEEDYIRYHKQIKLYNKKIAKIETGLSQYNRDESIKMIKEYKIKIDKLEKELDDTIDFFYSDWFRTLSTKDPEMILEKLEALVDDS